MNAIFAILITLAALLLIGVVLIQKSKGGGLATNVSSYNQIAGVRKTTDFIEKATWTLICFIIVMSIVSTYIPRGGNSEAQVTNVKQAQETQATPFETTGNTPAQETPSK